MKIDEIRERFLKFFEKRGHTICPSDSLVPTNDPSLLFTGAGMNQFKDMFLGKGRLPFKRAATSQKCLRTGDIEKVGKTAAHQTFFEMLGNFSFGDYFKEEAIQWAWEFLTNELKIPAERLYVSIYEDDDEAYKIWRDKVKVPEAKIFRFGEGENFWPANAPSEGPNGPCGPCSEIYYDFGPQYGCGLPTCAVGCACNRYVEVWNLVFTQFDRQEDGTLAPLPQKNIDTGMGLERLGAVIQGVHSNFETDIFKPLIQAISDIVKVKYDESTESGAKMRRMADHTRAVTFCLCDGVLPSNEGRGYVERKILRLALRDALTLNYHKSFLYKLVPLVAELMGKQYPELREREKNIARLMKGEEEKFLETVEQGTRLLEQIVERLKGEGKKTLPGEEAFMLYDTYGFPLEMTDVIVREKGLAVDHLGFEKALERQRILARTQTKIAADIFGAGPLLELKAKFKPTEFLGYKHKKAEVTVLALIKGEQGVGKAVEGDEVAVLLDQTPFYGESGGQIGDTGTLRNEKVKLRVLDTTRPEGYFLHRSRVLRGTLSVGDKVLAKIDAERRLNIMRHHSATHLLQSALRTVLGGHVEQAGSLVAPDRLRFDFTHYAPLTREEIRKVEAFVNAKIMRNVALQKDEMLLADAKRAGALMFFGEKYGDTVRVVSIGDFSKELCGGTHLKRTGTIGLFKITSETSIGAGIRRLEAVTGPAALQRIQELDELADTLSTLLSAARQNVAAKAQQLVEDVRQLKQKLARALKGGAHESLATLLASAKTLGAEKIIVHKFTEPRKPDELRSLIDQLIRKNNIAAALLATDTDGKQVYMMGVRKDLIARGIRADDLARKIGALCGGGGGGKEHLAQAGGIDSAKIESAFAEFEKMVRNVVASQ